MKLNLKISCLTLYTFYARIKFKPFILGLNIISEKNWLAVDIFRIL